MIAVAQALRSVLAANSDVTALVGSHIYNGFVPAGVTAKTVMVLAVNSGGLENITPQRSFDMRYVVKCVAENGRVAANGATLIRDALHNAEPGTIDGWFMMRVDVTTYVEFVEQEDKRQWHHSGWIIRVRGYEEE